MIGGMDAPRYIGDNIYTSLDNIVISIIFTIHNRRYGVLGSSPKRIMGPFWAVIEERGGWIDFFSFHVYLFQFVFECDYIIMSIGIQLGSVFLVYPHRLNSTFLTPINKHYV